MARNMYTIHSVTYVYIYTHTHTHKPLAPTHHALTCCPTPQNSASSSRPSSLHTVESTSKHTASAFCQTLRAAACWAGSIWIHKTQGCFYWTENCLSIQFKQTTIICLIVILAIYIILTLTDHCLEISNSNKKPIYILIILWKSKFQRWLNEKGHYAAVLIKARSKFCNFRAESSDSA